MGLISTVNLLLVVYNNGKRINSPFAVLVHVGVRLHRVFFDEKFNALIKGCCHRWRLFAQQYLNGIVRGQTHDVFGTNGMRTAFTVRTISHAIYLGDTNK